MSIRTRMKSVRFWIKRKIVWFLTAIGILTIAFGATQPITPNQQKWKAFTDNLIAIEYRHNGTPVEELKNIKGIWEPTEKEFEQVYEYVYGDDMVVWQKLDGTEMCPLQTDGTGRIPCVPHWQQEFNHAKQRESLRNGVRENKVFEADTYDLNLQPISKKGFDFRNWVSKLFQVDYVYAQGVEFEDHVTYTPVRSCEVAIPDTTGTGYNEIILVGEGYMYWGGSQFDMRGGSIDNDEGQLCETQDTMSQVHYVVEIYQKGGDTGDNYNFIACRIQDADNFYALKFNESATYLYSRTTVGGWTDIGGGDGGGIADTSTVKLSCRGTEIKAYDDDVEILSAMNSDHSPAGKAGVGMGALQTATDDGAGQMLDDFVVTIATEPAIIPPVITTDVATGTDKTSVTLNATIDLKEATTTYVFFNWGTTTDTYYTTTTPSTTKTASSTFAYELTGLDTFTDHYYRGGATGTAVLTALYYADNEETFWTATIPTTTDSTSEWEAGTHSTTTAIGGNLVLVAQLGGGGPATSTESFEDVADGSQDFSSAIWRQATISADDGNWQAESGATGSGTTGASDGSDGTDFIYTEASSGQQCQSNNDCIIEFTMGSGWVAAQIAFDWNMDGVNYGTVTFDTYDGVDWTTRWSETGDHNDIWFTQYVDIPVGTTELRFVAPDASGYSADFSLDYLRVATTSGDYVNGSWTSLAWDVGSITSVDDSIIEWSSTTPANTSTTIYAAINTSTSTPPTGGDWDLVAASGDSIADATGDLSGKFLWVKIDLNTIDTAAAPKVHDLRIGINQNGAPPPAPAPAGNLQIKDDWIKVGDSWLKVKE